MPRIKLKQLQTGQVISRDVTMPNGRLLIRAGTVIASRQLEVLRTWGVVEVEIEGDGPEREQPDLDFDALPEAAREQIQQRLHALFKHCDLNHPLIEELLRYQRLRISRDYHRGEG